MIACPHCKSIKSKVVSSRQRIAEGIKRKRVCDDCLKGFWTVESIFTPQPPKKKQKPPPRPRKRRLKPRLEPTKPKPEPDLPDFANMTDQEIEDYFYSDD